MNKATGIVVIAVIIGVIAISAGISMSSDEGTDVISEEVVLEEQEEAQEGRNISVELTESIGLKGP